MKNNIHKYDNEIDLIDIFKTIWNERIQFFLITIISLAIISIYNLQQPKVKTQSFNNHLKIQSAKKSEFIKFIPIFDPNSKHSDILQVFLKDFEKKFKFEASNSLL